MLRIVHGAWLGVTDVVLLLGRAMGPRMLGLGGAGPVPMGTGRAGPAADPPTHGLLHLSPIVSLCIYRA